MNNNNPAEMSNEDLEKDMEQKNLETPKGNQEKLNKSTAAEGTLKTPEQDESSKENGQAAEKEASDLGTMPDPEALDNWESNDDDPNKISS
jgi:hypothetical protein